MPMCNWCGDAIEKSNGVDPPLMIKYSFGYNSSMDLDVLDVALCPCCAEKLAEYLIAQCVISPTRENTEIL